MLRITTKKGILLIYVSFGSEKNDLSLESIQHPGRGDIYY